MVLDQTAGVLSLGACRPMRRVCWCWKSARRHRHYTPVGSRCPKRRFTRRNSVTWRARPRSGRCRCGSWRRSGPAPASRASERIGAQSARRCRAVQRPRTPRNTWLTRMAGRRSCSSIPRSRRVRRQATEELLRQAERCRSGAMVAGCNRTARANDRRALDALRRAAPHSLRGGRRRCSRVDARGQLRRAADWEMPLYRDADASEGAGHAGRDGFCRAHLDLPVDAIDAVPCRRVERL